MGRTLDNAMLNVGMKGVARGMGISSFPRLLSFVQKHLKKGSPS